jgi:hypothetical protein
MLTHVQLLETLLLHNQRLELIVTVLSGYDYSTGYSQGIVGGR